MSIAIEFKKIVVRNFLSFGNQETELDLSHIGTTLINGENVDTGGANGVGKTAIINAICYALYNKPKDNISLQRLINSTNVTKNTLMEVRLTFTKGEDEYEVYRARGTEYKIELKCNGDNITPDSIAESDRKIEEILGISYDLFTRVVIFAGSSIPFLELPIHGQRTHIEELFNITLLSEKAVTLKESIKMTENDVNIQEAVLKEQSNAKTLYQKHLLEAEERITRWETSKETSIVEISTKLESVKDINFEEEQEFHELKTELSQKKLGVTTKLNQLSIVGKQLQKDHAKYLEECLHLSDAKCPYCLQKYDDAPKKISELQDKITEKQTTIEANADEVQKLNVELKQIEDDLEIIVSNIKHDNISQLLDIRANTGILSAKLIELQGSTNPHTEAYEKLLVEAVKEPDYTILDTLKTRLEHQQFLLKLLTDKNSFIRRKIINRTIPFLNSRLNHYTTELGLPHVAKFDADMSCAVSEFGRELDFGNLSSGEKKRVNLAMSLAFRDVLHHLHARINILFADEIDMSLDASGVDSVIRLLKRKCRDDELGIWVIMHRPEVVGRFDRDVIIKKENGFSSITYSKIE